MNKGVFDMFENLSGIINQEINQRELSTSIVSHLQNLKSELNTYFPEIDRLNMQFNLVRNPFLINPEDLDETIQECFIDMIIDSSIKDLYEEKNIQEFWLHVFKSYPAVAEQSLKILLCFPSSYLCESGFSALLNIKINIEQDCLSKMT